MPYNKDKESGFVISCMYGHLDIVKLFIEEWDYSDHDDLSYGLMRAIMSSKDNILSYLFEKNKFLVDSTTEQGATIIHLLSAKKNCFTVLLNNNYPLKTIEDDSSYLKKYFSKNIDTYNIILSLSNIQQVNHFLIDLITDDNINLINNASLHHNLILLFKLFKIQSHDNLKILDNTCKSFLITEHYKPKANLLLHEINKIKIFYDLNKDLSIQPDKILKKKI